MHGMKWVDEQTVLQRADIVQLAAEMKDFLRQGGRERALLPPREVLFQQDPEAIYVSMPAASVDCGLYINKVGSIFPRAVGDSLPTVHACVVAMSARHGRPLALLDGAALTRIKCAAVAAMVTDQCAIPDAHTLTICGTGVQAWQQYLAVTAVRPIQTIRVYARRPEAAAAFVAAIRQHTPKPLILQVETDLEQAIAGADVVATATSAESPLGEFARLQPHVHINCMGGHNEQSRELPWSVLQSALVLTEDVPMAIVEAGEVHQQAHPLEALLTIPVQTLQAQRTVFSSIGHAWLDLLATAHVLQRLD